MDFDSKVEEVDDKQDIVVVNINREAMEENE